MLYIFRYISTFHVVPNPQSWKKYWRKWQKKNQIKQFKEIWKGEGERIRLKLKYVGQGTPH